MRIGRRTRALASALGLGLGLAAAAAGGADQAGPLDLEGTWYVLVHYRDEASANPDAMRWLDLVWTFERKADSLQWTEYPIVVFEDTSGRFEPTPGNPRSRVLQAWEPSPEQRRTIDEGPHVNRRGSRTKLLEGSDQQGWHSKRGRPRTSAMVMHYEERLGIEQLSGLPVFLRRDSIGTAFGRDSEGGSSYRVTERGPGGRELRGDYQRDEIRRGRFRMWRTAPVRALVPKPRKTIGEQIQAEVEDLQRRAAEGDPEAIRILEDAGH